MAALITIGCILLFFAVLLLSSVRLRFKYAGGKMRAVVYYLFLRIDFSPDKLAKRSEKRKERQAAKGRGKKKAAEEAKPKEEKAASDTAKTIWSIVKASKKGLNTICRHLVFYKINAAAAVGAEDSHKTATLYATICTLTSAVLSVLESLFVVKKPKIVIRPCFLLEKTELSITFRVRIRPWYVLAGGIQILTSFMKFSNKNKLKRKKVKGGKQNESKASCQ